MRRREFLVGALLAGLLPTALSTRASARKLVHHPQHVVHRNDAKKDLRPVVVIDPGHGAKDPGAIGVSGLYEKRVALAAAQLLKRHLEATGKYRVRLTRVRDVFIPLAGRVALAERHGASLFISMHADALTHHNVRGASVYTYALNASDPEAAELARRENKSDRFVSRRYRDLKPNVRQILSNLIVQETRIGSAAIQHSVVRNLRNRIVLLRNPAREAHFAVLRSATIPSVLVEMGFMSNRHDEQLLRQPKHRVVIASAMARAVEGYFAKAQGSRLFSG